MKLSDFPRIKRDGVATRNGNFYVQREASSGLHWYKQEIYLPSATGTLREPLGATCERFMTAIKDGSKPFRFAITDGGLYDHKKYDKQIAKWFPDEYLEDADPDAELIIITG